MIADLALIHPESAFSQKHSQVNQTSSQDSLDPWSREPGLPDNSFSSATYILLC